MHEIFLPPFKRHGELQPIQAMASGESTEYQWDKVMMDAHKAHEAGFDGTGVKIGILDTGKRKADHPDLLVSEVKAARSFVPNETVDDGNGHGTAVHSCISAKHNGIGMAGTAPGAEIYIAKVLGNNGGGSLDSLIKGTEWLLSQGCNIINGSLGFGTATILRNYDNVLRKGVDSGVAFVFASGNGGKDNEIDFPSSSNRCFGVGAINARGEVASFSNKSLDVDVVAPGVNIMVVSHLHNGYLGMSGTSFSSPNTAGMLGCFFQWYKAKKGKFPTYEEAYYEITKFHVDDLGTKGLDPKYGYGLIRPKLVVESSPVPEDPCPQLGLDDAKKVVEDSIDSKILKAIYHLITNG